MLVIGGGATLVMAALMGVLAGVAGVRGALAAGLVAIGMTVLAERLVRRTGRQKSVDQLGVYGIGVVLRMLGVLLVGVLVMRDRATFPPLPTAFGYLGVILPLLYLETQRTQ